MPTNYVVKPNQSMPDVIVQATGSMEAGMQFCNDNGISISSVPATGTVYKVTDSALGFGDPGVLKYYIQNGIVAGTLSPRLNMRIILKPAMDISITGTSINPYHINLEANAQFLNEYGLISSYLSNNPLLTESPFDYLADLGASAVSQNDNGAYTMPDKKVSWELNWAPS